MTMKPFSMIALGWPMFLLCGLLIRPLRKWLPRLLWLAPLPAFILVFFEDVGAPVTLLLGAAAALWSIGGWAVPSYFPGGRPGVGFIACWLLTLTGSLGVFLVEDRVGFLVFYALVSLPAYGLVVSEGTPPARRAGRIYLGFAILGENLLLAAFVILSRGVMPLPPIAAALLIAGFGAKIALLPLHFWMPLSYTAAPIPAAAVLSGAAVKAGIIGLLRFLPMETTPVMWGGLLVTVGFCGAFYGVAVGLTQCHPKTILAYSSVSQMGFLAAIIGMGVATHDGSVATLAAFYGAHHVLAKGALFLAVGACAARLSLTVAPAALIGLGLAGLPLTGGALAKLAVKAPFGYGPAATLASLSAAGTALLMTHFLFRLADARKIPAVSSGGGLAPWLLGAVACLAFPWVALSMTGLSWSDVVAPVALWKTLWPVLLGGTVGVFLQRIRIPKIPAGDILALTTPAVRTAQGAARALGHLDTTLRHWPVACGALLVIVLALLFAAWL